MEEIEEMKKKDYERGLKMIDEAKVKYEELKNLLKEKYNGSTTQKIIGWDGKEYNVLVDEYQEYIERYKYFYKLSQEQLKKDIENHYIALQKKVEKKIGKMKLMTKTTNGYDYHIVGETGECDIQVILAGGYNIQRLHTRWIIKNDRAFN